MHALLGRKSGDHAYEGFVHVPRQIAALAEGLFGGSFAVLEVADVDGLWEEPVILGIPQVVVDAWGGGIMWLYVRIVSLLYGFGGGV